jgi:hypothetical protein
MMGAHDMTDVQSMKGDLDVQLGSEPFGAGLMPETVAEIVNFPGASDASDPA